MGSTVEVRFEGWLAGDGSIDQFIARPKTKVSTPCHTTPPPSTHTYDKPMIIEKRKQSNQTNTNKHRRALSGHGGDARLHRRLLPVGADGADHHGARRHHPLHGHQ